MVERQSNLGTGGMLLNLISVVRAFAETISGNDHDAFTEKPLHLGNDAHYLYASQRLQIQYGIQLDLNLICERLIACLRTCIQLCV